MSEFAVSTFWQYVKPGDFATCDLCAVTQRPAELVSVEREGRTLHFCKDVERCARWRREASGAGEVGRL